MAFFDPVKYVSLGSNAYATFGADVRLRLDSYTGTDYAAVPEGGHAFLLQRYMTHADLHAGSRFRLFTQLKSGVVAGLDVPRPIDRNDLALHQLFADVTVLQPPTGQLILRLGRQEINYGRLLDMREGPNVRLSFDAVRVLAGIGAWRAEGVLARPVETDFGAFDDGWSTPRETLWGARFGRATGLGVGPRPVQATFYYLGLRRGEANFAQGAAPETRHTLGVKLGPPPIQSSGLGLEGAVQFGSHGEGRVAAWFATLEGGYVLNEIPLCPRLGLIATAASGDRDPQDPDLQTFSAPYSTQRTVPQGGLIGGYANVYQAQPSVTVHPHRRLSISLLWDVFWRQSTEDAAYTSGRFPLRRAPESRARFIGHVPRMLVQIRAGRYVSFDLRYEWLVGGAYLDASGVEANARYLALQATFKF